MMELYPRGTTDTSKRGVTIRPTEATVTYVENGQFDLEAVFAARDDLPAFDYGMIIRASVPKQTVAGLSLGNAEYWTVTNENGTNLYSVLPTSRRIKYAEWGDVAAYATGEKRTYNNQNYRCNATHVSTWLTPAEDQFYWSAISNYEIIEGTVVATLPAGTAFVRTGDFNSTYMLAATGGGQTGYVKIEDCADSGESEERIVPTFTITQQSFMITDIRKDDGGNNGKTVRITAEHVSYEMTRALLGECSVTEATPATALMFATGAAKEPFSGTIDTNITDIAITADWSWKNLQSVLLDPKNGMAALTNGQIIRDDRRVFLISKSEAAPGYRVSYGVNMKSVKWTGNTDNLVTRIYPVAQREDGSTLLLPEEHIDTVLQVPYSRAEVLKTGLKVGQTEKATDGTETKLDEQTVYARMREQAENRYAIDQCDRPEIKLELDWLHMPDTEEYAQYTALENAAPGEWVEVIDGPLGINTVIQLTGYKFDPILCRYKSTTFGDQKARATVAGYQLSSGSVSARVLAAGAVGGENIRAGSITSREIEANSITSDLIAARSLTAHQIAADAITADEIAANSITSEKIAANAVTANKIDAGAVTAQKIDAGAVTAEKIDAGAVTAEKIDAGAVTAEKIGAGAVTAVKIAAQAVTAEKIGAGQVTADKIAAGAVTAVKIDAGAVTAEKIGAGAVTANKIDANAVTANKIASGAVTTEKLDAGAVTAGKIAAGAVTAEKIDAGAVNAEKISTADLSAIQAKLQIAQIANAQINSADISYAKVKDLVAGTAIFDTSITEQGIADKLYINRLLITYGQMVEATIGDLVIGASDGYYYHVDVEWDDDGVPTLVPTRVATPSAAEIAAGHTTGGQTIIGNIGTFADLSSEDFYAINSIIDRITAKRIDVDELWARQAFINKLMVQDISSNTYIQSTIGNWQSSSTITQAIDGLDSRISSLGYGTVYMQPDEPNHADLVSGDVWIQTLSDGTWQDIYNNQTDYPTWQAIYNTVSTWQVLGAIPIMWVWDGRKFQKMFDADLPTRLETEIQQLSDAITLRATKEEVQGLSDDVSVMEATLTIQAEEIAQAVSAVNAKAASFVMWPDPRTVYSVTLGDIWIKRDENFCDTSTWQDVYDEFATWQTLYNMHDAWEDMLGDRSFVWNGSAWVLTSDRASEIYQRTLIDQTSTQVGILAETTATLEGITYSNSAALVVANDRITQEVTRAMAAEGTKISATTQYATVADIIQKAYDDADALATSAKNASIAKTETYQTADVIVSTAVAQANSAAAGNYIAKTSSYQTADAIKTEAVKESVTAVAPEFETNQAYAVGDIVSYQNEIYKFKTAHSAGAWNASQVDKITSNAFLAKTTAYQTADAIVTEAVRQAGVNASGAYIAQTSTYQSAEAIKSSAVTAAGAAAAAAYIAKSGSYTSVDTLLNEMQSKANAAANSAKAASIAKTESLQTADAIVNSAIAVVDNTPQFSTSSAYAKGARVVYQGAIYEFTASKSAGPWDSSKVRQFFISNGYIAQTNSYQTADAIVTEAVRRASTEAAGDYIAKTTAFQSATDIYNTAIRQSAKTMAEEFSTSNTYLKGSIVSKDGKLYKFNVNHSAGAWNASQVTEIEGVTQAISEAAALAQTAENNAKGASIAKTETLTTADIIVSTAVAQAENAASGSYIAKTTSYQTADAIVNEAVRQSGVNASGAYIAKTTSYQTADSIVTEAVRQSGVNASGSYIAKTSSYQTADSIVSAAETYTNGQLSSYSTRTQTATMISNYVTEHAYGLVSGIEIKAAGIEISGSQYVKIASGGYFQVKTGNFGIDSNSDGYVVWSGASTAAGSSFRVKKNGEVTVTKLMALGEDGVTETQVDLHNASLWKLNYRTVRTFTASTTGGQTTITLGTSNGDLSVNFNNAASVVVSTVAVHGNPSADAVALPLDIALSNGITEEKAVAVGAWRGKVYNLGWNDAVDAGEVMTLYTRNDGGGYGGSGNTHYVKSGNTYISVGANWYQTAAQTVTVVPGKKT